MQQFGLVMQVLRAASKHDFALDQNHIAVGDLADMLPVFVNNHAADTGVPHQPADAPDVPGDQRRQAFSGFVQNQDIRIGHQRPANGEHLLLAAAQLLAAVPYPFLQSWKGVQDAVMGSVALTLDARALYHF